MTLLIVVLFGAGALLIISAIEDVSISQSVDDIISGQISSYDWTGAKGSIQQQADATSTSSGSPGGGGPTHALGTTATGAGGGLPAGLQNVANRVLGSFSPDVGVAPSKSGWWNVGPGFHPEFPAGDPRTNITQAHNPPVETGVDIGTPFHTPITAIQRGTVTDASYGPWGGSITVRVPSGHFENYLHLDDIYVMQGQQIAAGQELGLSGGQLGYGDHPAQRPWSSGAHTEFGDYTERVYSQGQWQGSLDPNPILSWLSSGG